MGTIEGLQGPSPFDISHADRIQKAVVSGLVPGLKDHAKDWKTRVGLTFASALGLLTVIACSPAKAGENPIPPTGIGGPGLIKTFAETARRSVQNSAIEEANRKADAEAATATAVAQAEAQKPPTPEVKTLQCDILSPEACATGEYIEWNSARGIKLRGIGFTLKLGEEIYLPKDGLAVSKVVLKQPDIYNGVFLATMSKDGQESYGYWGNISTDLIKPGSLLAGTITDAKSTVFEDQPYNLIFVASPTFMEKFAGITKNPPKAINNKVPGEEQAANVPIFYGVTPPKP